MEEERNTTQPEETAEMTQQESADFEAAFDEREAAEEAPSTEEDTQEAPAEEAPAEGEEAQPREEEKVELDGKQFTKAELSGLLGRMSQLQAQANAPVPETELVKRLAAQSGMEPEAFMQQADTMIREAQITGRYQQLKEQGYADDMARQSAEVETENAMMKRRETLAESELKSQETTRQGNDKRVRAEVEEFTRLYPNATEIPHEVIDDVAQSGSSLVVAYQKHLLAEKEKELALLEQQNKNKERAAGSVKGRGLEQEDPFITELMK